MMKQYKDGEPSGNFSCPELKKKKKKKKEKRRVIKKDSVKTAAPKEYRIF